MICKWCGAKVDPGKKSCGRCGRKIPPVSDCGGFYDVVPNAPTGEMPAVAAAYSAPARPAPAPRGTPGVVKAVIAGLAVLVVILTIVVITQGGKLRDAEARLNEPQRPTDLLATPDQVPATEPVTEETEPDSEPTEDLMEPTSESTEDLDETIDWLPMEPTEDFPETEEAVG